LLPLISGCSKAPEKYPDIEDGSTWTETIDPGFKNKNNYAVVAMAEYNGYFYAMTRNEVEGAEIWRSPDGKKTTWEQVSFPDGETNGVYGNKWLNEPPRRKQRGYLAWHNNFIAVNGGELTPRD
jgi:hypothetical protein